MLKVSKNKYSGASLLRPLKGPLKCGRNSRVVVIVKLHQFAGQVRVWSARLKGEPLVNLVAF